MLAPGEDKQSVAHILTLTEASYAQSAHCLVEQNVAHTPVDGKNGLTCSVETMSAVSMLVALSGRVSLALKWSMARIQLKNISLLGQLCADRSPPATCH